MAEVRQRLLRGTSLTGTRTISSTLSSCAHTRCAPFIGTKLEIKTGEHMALEIFNVTESPSAVSISAATYDNIQFIGCGVDLYL